MPSDSSHRRRRNVKGPRITTELRKDRLRRISLLEERSNNQISESARQLALARQTLSDLLQRTDRASSINITDLRARIRNLEDRIANQTDFLGKLNKRKNH